MDTETISITCVSSPKHELSEIEFIVIKYICCGGGLFGAIFM